jgi:hypothetical protein
MKSTFWHSICLVIHFNNILPSRSRSPNWSFPCRFVWSKCSTVCIFLVLRELYRHDPPYFHWFYYPKNITRRVKFSAVTNYFPLQNSNCLSQLNTTLWKIQTEPIRIIRQTDSTDSTDNANRLHSSGRIKEIPTHFRQQQGKLSLQWVNGKYSWW